MHIFNAQGFTISVGFNPIERIEAASIIFWCDPTTKEWVSKDGNLAGWIGFPDVVLNPEFVRESPRGFFMYQPGLCLEAELVGGPFVWRFMFLRPKE